MDSVIQILAKLSPTALVAVLTLGVIGGLGYVIFLLVKQGNEARSSMQTLTSNHLHDLPDIAETLRRIETQQGAMAAALLTQLSDIRTRLEYVAARVNGHSSK